MRITKSKVSEWSASGIIGGIAFAIVMGVISFVTGSWAAVAPFVVGHPLESIVCALAVMALGILVGAAIRHRVAMNQSDATKKRIAELEKQVSELGNRPTQEQLDAALEKEHRLEDAEDEKTEDSPILTGEKALNFMRSLTDNQHAILKEMYENGGTLLADSLDGDMQQLAKYGMVERPSLFVPGMETKWTLPPNVNMIIREHPDVLESDEEKRQREANAALDQFSVAQLDLMARIADAESSRGCLLLGYASQDGRIASQLQELDVATCDTSRKDRCGWYLAPRWRKFVNSNRDLIDECTKDLREKREKEAEKERRRKAEAPSVDYPVVR